MIDEETSAGIDPTVLEDRAKYSFAEAKRLLDDMQRLIGGLAAMGQIDIVCARELLEKAEGVEGHLCLITAECMLVDDLDRYSDGRSVNSVVRLDVKQSDVEKLAPLASPEGDAFPDLPMGWVAYTWHPERDEPRDRNRVLAGEDEIPGRMYGYTKDAVVAVNTTGRYKVIVAEPGRLATIRLDGAVDSREPCPHEQ